MPSANSFTTYCSNLIILPQHQNLHISPLVDIRLNLKLFLLTSFQEISEIFKDMYVPIDCCSISPLSYQTFFFIVRVCVKFNFKAQKFLNMNRLSRKKGHSWSFVHNFLNNFSSSLFWKLRLLWKWERQKISFMLSFSYFKVVRLLSL